MDQHLTVGVLGAGTMARAIIEGALRAHALSASQIVATRRDLPALEAWCAETGTQSEPDAQALAARSDLLLVGLKPQMALSVLAEVAPSLRPGALIVSLVAGIPCAAMEAVLPEGQAVVRLMPNTPCLVGCGATGLSLGSAATEEEGDLVSRLLSSVGEVWVIDEGQMDALTAVSGSGPAYVFRLMEAMEEAAVEAGLTRSMVSALVAQTVAGAAALAQASPKSSATLRAEVTSPGGTTEAALNVLAEEGFGKAVQGAIAAATARGRALGREKG